MDQAADSEVSRSASPAGGESDSGAGGLEPTERKVRIAFAFALACFGLVGVVS